MASNIDETKPTTGIDQPVEVIRNNFAIAKIEIGALQSDKLDRDGTSAMTGPLPLASFITINLPPAFDNTGSVVFVSDAIPNSTPFFSDGISWKPIGSLDSAFITVKNFAEPTDTFVINNKRQLIVYDEYIVELGGTLMIESGGALVIL